MTQSPPSSERSQWVVILAGGSGTRFWPLSTPSRPKQLLPLTGAGPTAIRAVEAARRLVERDRILVVTGSSLLEPLSRELELPRENFLVEPRAASTGPALVSAAHEAERRTPGATLLCMHADWDLPDLDAFAESGRRAFAATAAGDLVTCGIVPTRAETGYGYIIPGDPLPGGARRVARFTEKPDQGLAERLISEGALWNSGLFCWRATRLREEVERHAPEIAKSLSHLDRADVDRFFAEVTPVAIDNGVLERSPNVAVVDGRFPWDDVGTWAALSRTRKQDALGNVSQGSVHQVGSSNCVAWAESAHVVLAGVKDLVVVEANGRILVMPSGKAAQLKEVLDQLPPDVRDLK